MSDIIADLVSCRGESLVKPFIRAPPANLADLVRMANTYYSNLIEGHNTRPKDIERALVGQSLQGQGAP